MVRTNKDILGGVVFWIPMVGLCSIVDNQVLETTWRAYYEKLSNEEFTENKDTLLGYR